MTSIPWLRGLLAGALLAPCVQVQAAEPLAPAGAAAAGAAVPAQAPEAPAELDPIIVTGKDDPLRDAGRRLRERLEAQLPCMGCGGDARPDEAGVVDALISAFLQAGPAAPPDDSADRAALASGVRHDRRLNDKAP